MAARTPGGLIRGLSLGELSPRSPEIALTPFDFDTKKVATHGTLKRLKLVKSPTDTQLFVPNQVPTLVDPGTNESMLTSLTADFDEKMKLLLDPNYSGGSQSDTSSVQSTPSKKYTHPNLRRISEQPPRPPKQVLQPPQKNNRSLSLGEDPPPISQMPSEPRNKKSELKRGRVVDKNHPPPSKKGQDEKENFVKLPRMKMKNRKLRRRHTVGGTKDFAEFDLDATEAPPDEIATHEEDILDSMFHPALSNQYHHSVMLNVDRSLGQWIRRQKIGKSSPDLSLIGRRLSLPDSVLAAAFQPFTSSLLESQV